MLPFALGFDETLLRGRAFPRLLLRLGFSDLLWGQDRFFIHLSVLCFYF